MGVQSHPKRLALDTNVVMDLAAGVKAAEGFREKFQAAGYDLRIPPTVQVELAYFSFGQDEKRKALARLALASLGKWRITPIVLSTIEECQGKNFVTFVLDRGILPPNEEHDALILAEVGLADFKALVTSDAAILNADPVELERAFKDSGISPVTPVHPRRMLKALR